MRGLPSGAPSGVIDTRQPVNLDHPLNRGLVSWWLPFGNWQGGDTLRDLTKRNNGTLTNGPTWATGPNGFGALSFDGSDDRVLMDGAATPFGSGFYPVTAWAAVRPASLHVGSVISVSDAGFFSRIVVELSVLSDGTVRHYTAAGTDVTLAGGSYAAGSDILISATSVSATDHRLYLNGVNVATSTTSSGATFSANACTLGANRTGGLGFSPFSGRHYGAGLLSVAWTDAQHAILYDQWRTGYPDLLNRVRAWSFGVDSATGGTNYPESYSGSCTPSGTLTKAVSKSLTGSCTSSGTLAKACTKPLSGSVTATGLLTKAATKALAGSVTPSATLTKAVTKSLTGSVTPSGALSNVSGKGVSLSGSCTTSGALTKACAKPLSGSVTCSATLTKACTKSLSGSCTASGVVTNVKQLSTALSGSVTPSGVLANVSGKGIAPSASLTPSGALANACAKSLSGSCTASGTIARACAKSLSGSCTTSGECRKAVAIVRTGSCSTAGSFSSQVPTLLSLTGSCSASGVLTTERTAGRGGRVLGTVSLYPVVGGRVGLYPSVGGKVGIN